MALKENDILVDMLRAPVNPADINKIQGMQCMVVAVSLCTAAVVCCRVAHNSNVISSTCAMCNISDASLMSLASRSNDAVSLGAMQVPTQRKAFCQQLVAMKV